MAVKITLLIVCIVIFFYASNTMHIGRTVNKWFPCQQNPQNSFPCYGWIDLSLAGIFLLVGLVLCILIGIHAYKLWAR